MSDDYSLSVHVSRLVILLKQPDPVVAMAAMGLYHESKVLYSEMSFAMRRQSTTRG